MVKQENLCGRRFFGNLIASDGLANQPIGLANGTTDIVEKQAICFTATGTQLTGVRLHFIWSQIIGYSQGDGGEVQVELVEDNNGQPTGAVLAVAPTFSPDLDPVTQVSTTGKGVTQEFPMSSTLEALPKVLDKNK